MKKFVLSFVSLMPFSFACMAMEDENMADRFSATKRKSETITERESSSEPPPTNKKTQIRFRART